MTRAAAILLASMSGAWSVPAVAQEPAPSSAVPRRSIGGFDGADVRPAGIAGDARLMSGPRRADDRWIGGGARPPENAWTPESARIAEDDRIAEDAWIAEDKARHLFASLAITAVSFGLATALDVEWPDAGLAAGAVAGVAGLGKEVRDYRRGRPFSVKDLAWDAAGIGAGLVLASAARR